MLRVLGRVLVVLLLVAGAGAIWAYQHVRGIEVEEITPDVRMISGIGSNVGVLRTSDGAVVVDTMMFRMQGQRVREIAERVGGGPVQAVINTHYHYDHTHGNPGFAPGTKVVSTARTREHLLARDAAYWQGSAAESLPDVTFTGEHELRIGGKTIRSFHVGRGHTDGDLVVLFVEDRVLHTGDLVFNGLYPNIDLEAGGSVKEWGNALDRVLQLDFDRVIPGHGPATDRAGIERFQGFVRELASVAADAAAKGQSLDEFVRSAPLRADAGFEPVNVPFVLQLDRPFVLRRAFEEATGAVTPAP
ncbi:MAG: MBL fold metallo-hydrolase [Deltaproteobacteria bacterium]|nr:MBL fold metallo-hydrolase [Deltaproteobacteria bacterium]